MGEVKLFDFLFRAAMPLTIRTFGECQSYRGQSPYVPYLLFCSSTQHYQMVRRW